MQSSYSLVSSRRMWQRRLAVPISTAVLPMKCHLLIATRDHMMKESITVATLADGGAGYGGDVWPRQPAPPDHPWRYMPCNAMTPHMAGLTIDAQVRLPYKELSLFDLVVSPECDGISHGRPHHRRLTIDAQVRLHEEKIVLPRIRHCSVMLRRPTCAASPSTPSCSGRTIALPTAQSCSRV